MRRIDRQLIAREARIARQIRSKQGDVAKPISPTSLLRQLSISVPNLIESACGWLKQSPEPQRIGLCVSGGADSMAAAYLLKHIENPECRGFPLFSPKAFIVDHGARAGSDAEAIQVQKSLRRIGMDAEILQLTWDPTELGMLLKSGFEEKARRLRYRRIAEAALKDKISNIFTGHHEDDNIETILLRLIRDESSNLLGLRGMNLISSVPCCETIPNVRPHSKARPNSLTSLHSCPGGSSIKGMQESNFHRGMSLVRPLLNHSKDEILATCATYNIPYLQDSTNFDPTFTSRNAIRSLRSHSKLPKALQAESLTELARYADHVSEDCQRRASDLWGHVVRFHLHSHTGMLKISFKPFQKPLELHEISSFSHMMATLFGIISPCSSEDWPTLLDKRSTKELLAYLQDRQDSSSGISTHASITVKKAVIRNVLSDIDTDAASFTISRQPMRLEEKRAATVTFEQTPATMNDSQRRLSRWLLWDHRFWIRVRSYQANVIDRVVLRPYEPEDVSALKLALQNSESADDLMQVLATNAPGDVRFTLPVLVFDGQLIGFPTLGISFVPVSTLASDYRFARSQRTVSFLLDQVPKLDLDSETSTYRKTVSQPESRSNLEQPLELLRGL